MEMTSWEFRKTPSIEYDQDTDIICCLLYAVHVFHSPKRDASQKIHVKTS